MKNMIFTFLLVSIWIVFNSYALANPDFFTEKNPHFAKLHGPLKYQALEPIGISKIENQAIDCFAKLNGNEPNTTLKENKIMGSCLPGNITFSTQAQINSFPTDYPGCDTILGNVVITSNDIIDLTPLSQIRRIGGNLNFFNAQLLPSLNGLQSLASIGGVLYLTNCFSLQDLNGLNGLTSIGLHLWISNSGQSPPIYLKSLNGLNNLVSIGGDLDITYLQSIKNFNGLNSLSSVGGYALFAYLDSLESFEGLESLTTVNGIINIKENPRLLSLNGLQNLDPNTFSNLYITNNGNLSECSVESICDYLTQSKPATCSGNASGCSTVADIKSNCVCDSIYNQNDNKYYCSLEDALASGTTDDGDVLQIPAGTYSSTCFEVSKSIVIEPIGGQVILNCLNLNGASKTLELGGDLTINNLSLFNGKISTNGNNLTCGTITGGDPLNYIITD